MKTKTCSNCQYFRQPNKKGMFTRMTFCSNSKSTWGASYIEAKNTCKHFTRRGEKAPRWMRLANKSLTVLNRTIQKEWDAAKKEAKK